MAKTMYMICMSERNSGLRNALDLKFGNRIVDINATTFLVKSRARLIDREHGIWDLFENYDLTVAVARVYKKTLRFSVWLEELEELEEWLRQYFRRVWQSRLWLP